MHPTELSADEYLQSYQEWQDSTVWTTARGDHNWAVLGLVNEVGEIAQMQEKFIRKGNVITSERMKDELGDVLWNISNLCNLYGLTLVEVLEYNVDKIEKRIAESSKEA